MGVDFGRADYDPINDVGASGMVSKDALCQMTFEPPVVEDYSENRKGAPTLFFRDLVEMPKLASDRGLVSIINYLPDTADGRYFGILQMKDSTLRASYDPDKKTLQVYDIRHPVTIDIMARVNDFLKILEDNLQ